MNKLLKGSIAGAAGIALLLGGAGTLAYWNSSATLSNTTITSGQLHVAATGSWDETIVNWVPGDKATYTGNVTVTATGDNLKATLELVEDSLVFTGDLADALDVDFAITGALPAGVTGSAGSYAIAANAADTLVLPVTVTVELPYGGAVDNSSQSGSANLGGISFALTQVP